MEGASPAPLTAAGTDNQKPPGAAAPTSPHPSSATKSEPNGQPKRSKQGSEPKQSAAGAGSGTNQEGEPKLSGAGIKKRKQAEKQARRMAEKAAAQVGQLPQQPPLNRGGPQNKDQLQSLKPSDMGKHHKKSPSEVQGRPLPVRQVGASVGGKDSGLDVKQKKPQQDKRVSIFGHLYGQPRRTSLAGAGKEVHPAVLALGLQMRDYVICGSNARCVAMLLCFKRVIESYSTPSGTSLNRHLTQHLSHQIDYLVACRPLSISQGNSIRWLKLRISTIDPSTPEPKAKADLCEAIDSFIREKVTVADQVIARDASSKIENGDVILTYAKSSIVEKTLLEAHKAGKTFRVIVVDSRPLFEGRNLARSLSRAGIEVQYSLIHAISHAVTKATKVFLGAHAMMSNGRLYSRVGTAMVAMMAKEKGINLPVTVCCETVKFTGRVTLDSIVMNEIGSPDDLVDDHDDTGIVSKPGLNVTAKDAGEKGGKKGQSKGGDNKSKANKSGGPGAGGDSDEESPQAKKGLQGWRDQPNLQLLNIMYDVTPARYLDIVITEVGSLPPSAVPIVHRLSDEKGA